MKAWKTIAVFDFPHEIVLLRSRLEDAQIPHFFKDEFAVQTSYALAVGGIKLQVADEDVDEVYGIMQEVGLSDRLPQPHQPDFFEQLSLMTAEVPVLRNIAPEARWLVLLSACMVPTLLVLFFVFQYL